MDREDNHGRFSEVGANDLENRIEKLEEGLEKSNQKLKGKVKKKSNEVEEKGLLNLYEAIRKWIDYRENSEIGEIVEKIGEIVEKIGEN